MMPLDPAVVWTLRLALALVFAGAVRHKVAAPADFAAAVRAYRLVPAATAGVVAALLVVAEAAAAVLLLWPGGLGLGAAVAAGLLGLYAAAIGVNLARGRRDLDCGCAGPAARRPVSGALVARNLVYLAAALALLAPAGARALVWLDAATVAFATATLAALATGVGHLDANRPAVARARGTA
jgi:hypothetical protein